MKRSTVVLLGLLALVIGEVAVLSAVGRAIGVWPLLGILAVEALAGAALLRLEGRKAWESLRAAQREPEKMGQAMSDAALIMVGAALLMLPGFVTDALGLFFLLPPTRGLARRGLSGVFRVLTRKYRDRADVVAARFDRTTIVEGETVIPGETVADQPRPPRADGPTIIRGEIAD